MTDICFLAPPEVRSPSSRCQQAWFLLSPLLCASGNLLTVSPHGLSSASASQESDLLLRKTSIHSGLESCLQSLTCHTQLQINRWINIIMSVSHPWPSHTPPRSAWSFEGHLDTSQNLFSLACSKCGVTVSLLHLCSTPEIQESKKKKKSSESHVIKTFLLQSL